MRTHLLLAITSALLPLVTAQCLGPMPNENNAITALCKDHRTGDEFQFVDREGYYRSRDLDLDLADQIYDDYLSPQHRIPLQPPPSRLALCWRYFTLPIRIVYIIARVLIQSLLAGGEQAPQQSDILFARRLLQLCNVNCRTLGQVCLAKTSEKDGFRLDCVPHRRPPPPPPVGICPAQAFVWTVWPHTGPEWPACFARRDFRLREYQVEDGAVVQKGERRQRNASSTTQVVLF
ncbi:hypothetical protein ANO11243_029980 [Dothideomycetidae sp. 11243]|nr:hypothetical protein ANO11243_029980 [fungal sp. No.11243]